MATRPTTAEPDDRRACPALLVGPLHPPALVWSRRPSQHRRARAPSSRRAATPWSDDASPAPARRADREAGGRGSEPATRRSGAGGRGGARARGAAASTTRGGGRDERRSLREIRAPRGVRRRSPAEPGGRSRRRLAPPAAFASARGPSTGSPAASRSTPRARQRGRDRPLAGRPRARCRRARGGDRARAPRRSDSARRGAAAGSARRRARPPAAPRRRTSRSVGASLVAIATKSAGASCASNGMRPAMSSNIMTPSAQTSLRGSASRAPCTCSGAMYAGVPIIMPTSVARQIGRAHLRDAEVEQLGNRAPRPASRGRRSPA